MLRIGLIGGVTWAASADYYRRINLEIGRRRGGHHSADMVVRSVDLQPLLQRANDIHYVSTVFEAAARDLHAAGAQIAAVASFTGHRYVGKLAAVPLRFVDLTETIGSRVRAASPRRVAVWATSYALGDAALMESLAQRCATRLMPLPEAAREQVDSIVFNELAKQNLSDASILFLRQLLAAQIEAGAQALLLATTDFSPIAGVLDSTLPVLDATELHCAALVDAALDR